MRIEAIGERLEISLSKEEASAIQVDHGEGELIIPIPGDTTEVLMAVNDALGALVLRAKDGGS